MGAQRIAAVGLWLTRIDARAGLLALVGPLRPSEPECSSASALQPASARLRSPKLEPQRAHASQLACSALLSYTLPLRALEK